jgi:membrane protease YdiL (CAAX protease family)
MSWFYTLVIVVLHTLVGVGANLLLPLPAITLPLTTTWVLLTGIVSPFLEETIYRCLLWDSLAPWGPVAQLLGTTLVFSLCHLGMGWGYALAITPLSFMLGLARLKTGSMKVSVQAHVLANSTQLLFALLHSV